MLAGANNNNNNNISKDVTVAVELVENARSKRINMRRDLKAVRDRLSRLYLTCMEFQTVSSMMKTAAGEVNRSVSMYYWNEQLQWSNQ